jgi:hypothetical protein
VSVYFPMGTSYTRHVDVSEFVPGESPSRYLYSVMAPAGSGVSKVASGYVSISPKLITDSGGTGFSVCDVKVSS